MLYAAGRIVTEMYRGDVRRGFIIEGLLSHSQLISLGIITVALGVYLYLWCQSRTNEHDANVT